MRFLVPDFVLLVFDSVRWFSSSSGLCFRNIAWCSRSTTVAFEKYDNFSVSFICTKVCVVFAAAAAAVMHPGTFRSLCIHALSLSYLFSANSVDVCVCATAYVFANHVFRISFMWCYFVVVFSLFAFGLLFIHLKSIANTISFRKFSDDSGSRLVSSWGLLCVHVNWIELFKYM